MYSLLAGKVYSVTEIVHLPLPNLSVSESCVKSPNKIIDLSICPYNSCLTYFETCVGLA